MCPNQQMQEVFQIGGNTDNGPFKAGTF